MDPTDLLPLAHPALRSRLEELIGTMESAAWYTQHRTWKRVLGQLVQPLGHIADQTRTDDALEPLLSRYRAACQHAWEVTHAEGAPVAVLYEWFGWYLEALLAGTAPEEAQGLALAEAVLALLTKP